MTDSRLNKQLWTDINKLRLLRKADSNVRFLLDKSPFDEFDEEEETGASASLVQNTSSSLDEYYPNQKYIVKVHIK
jgi:hypothetical protein